MALEQPARGGDDLGTDAVAGKDDYARGALTRRDFTCWIQLATVLPPGLDVEPDVVEDERLRRLLEHRFGERRRSSSGSRASSGPRVTVEVNSSGSSGWTGFGSSQQRTSAKPARSSRSSVSSGEAKFQIPSTPSK